MEFFHVFRRVPKKFYFTNAFAKRFTASSENGRSYMSVINLDSFQIHWNAHLRYDVDSVRHYALIADWLKSVGPGTCSSMLDLPGKFESLKVFLAYFKIHSVLFHTWLIKRNTR